MIIALLGMLAAAAQVREGGAAEPAHPIHARNQALIECFF